MNKFSQWVITISSGIFFFFFFLLWFFPFDLVIQNFLTQFEAQTGGEYRITVSEIKPSVFFRSVFKNFELHSLAGGNDHVIVRFSEVRLGISYLPLLTNHIDASFTGKTEKGKVEGNISLSEGEMHFDSELTNISFSDFPSLMTKMKIPLQGEVLGNINIDFFPAQWNRNSGKIDLKFKNWNMPAAVIAPMTGLDLSLPAVVMSGKEPGVLKGKLSKGRFEIEKFTIPGPDLVLNANGYAQFNAKFPLSRIFLNGTIKFSDPLAQAIPLMVVLEKQKNEAGEFPIQVVGRLVNPNVKIGSLDLTAMAGGGPPPEDLPE